MTGGFEEAYRAEADAAMRNTERCETCNYVGGEHNADCPNEYDWPIEGSRYVAGGGAVRDTEATKAGDAIHEFCVENIERLAKERDEARAEVERLRAELDDWRTTGVDPRLAQPLRRAAVVETPTADGIQKCLSGEWPDCNVPNCGQPCYPGTPTEPSAVDLLMGGVDSGAANNAGRPVRAHKFNRETPTGEAK
jgi:hypothetical protein